MANDQGCKITLFWLNKSRAQTIVWLLEELKLDYELKIYHRKADMLAPEELKEGHPLGKSPVVHIETPDGRKLVLAETVHIVRYLTDHFGSHLRPDRWLPGKENRVGGETESYLRTEYLMEWVEGALMPALVMVLLANIIKTAPVPFFMRWLPAMIGGRIEQQVTPRAIDQLDFLETQLATAPGDGSFVTGDKLTGADIMVLFPLQASLKRLGVTKSSHPKVTEYVTRLEAISSYKASVQKIVEKDGKYDGAAL